MSPGGLVVERKVFQARAAGAWQGAVVWRRPSLRVRRTGGFCRCSHVRIRKRKHRPMNFLKMLLVAVAVMVFGVAGVTSARAVSVDRIEVLDYGTAGAVRVVFTGAVGAGSTNTDNYAISGSGRGTLAVHPGAVSAEDPASRMLFWSAGNMKTGGDVTISVSGILDAEGNALKAPTTATSAGGGLGRAPEVVHATVASAAPVAIDITFSLPMSDSALVAENYTVSGDGKGSLGEHPDLVTRNGDLSFRISWVSGEMRRYNSVLITVSGAEDLAGNAVAGIRQANVEGEATEPTVVSGQVVDGRTIGIVFSEAMDAGSVLNHPEYFSLGGPGRGTLASSPSSMDAVSQTEFRLKWAEGEMQIGESLDLYCSSGMFDVAGNSLGYPNSLTLSNAGIGTRPTVNSVTVDSTHKITVTYSEDMEYSAEYSSNYGISGPGKGTLYTSPSLVRKLDARSYQLEWYEYEGEMLGGETLMLSVSGSADLAGNLIEDGAPVLLTAVGVPPTITSRTPASGAALQEQTEVIVEFSEAVQLFPPEALSVNGRPATSVTQDDSFVPRFAFAGFDAPAEGEVTISIPRGAVKDLAGNPLGQSNWTVTLDRTPPYSVATTMREFSAGTTTISVDFFADDSGSGVASTTLWVKAPGAVGFVNTGISSSESGGVLVYGDATVNGLYEFATQATDGAGNSEPAPTSASASVLLNTVENGPFTQSLTTGDQELWFPMTDWCLVRIQLIGVSAEPGATMTVSRTTSARAAAPVYFKSPQWLMDEALTITASGSAAFSGEKIIWPYDAANLPASDPDVVTFMWIFDGPGANATPSGFFDIKPTDGEIVLQAGSVYGTMYVGSLFAESGVAASGWMVK